MPPPLSIRVSILLNQLRKLKSEKPSVIMLSVNSAVGSFTQAQRAHDAFKQFSYNQQVPVYTFSEDVALNVGYYLLSVGQKVHASIHLHISDPFSLIGDFSLYSQTITVDRLLAKQNIVMHQFGESPIANPFNKMTQQQKELTQQRLDKELELMLAQIKENRPRYDQATKVGVFNAEEALKNGYIDFLNSLVDEITTFDEFKNKYYPDSNVKEISLEKDISPASFIRAYQDVQIINELKSLVENPDQIPHQQEKIESIVLHFQDRLEDLEDILMQFQNQQIRLIQ